MRYRALTLFLLLAAISLGVAALRAGHDGRDPLPGAAPGNAAGAAPAPPAQVFEPVTARYELGARRSYAFRTTRDIELRTRDPANPGGEVLKIGLSGELTLTVVHASAPIEVEARLTKADPTAGEPGQDSIDPEAKRAAAEALKAPFYIQSTERGAITSLRFRRGLDPFIEGMLKSLAATLEFVTPPPGSAAGAWVADEADPTGVYVASYRRGEGDTFEKTRSKYRLVVHGESLVPAELAARVETSLRSRFELDDHGWPASLTSEESLRLDPGEGMPIIRSAATTTFKLLGAGVDMAAAARRTAPGYRAVSMTEPPDGEGSSQRRDAQIVGQATLTSLRAELGALGGRKDEGAARAALQARLSALFRLRPGDAQGALGKADKEMDAEARATVLAALGDAGTPEAQDALIEQASAHDEGTRLQALVSLGLTEEPTGRTMAMLELATTDRAAGPEAQSTAALALGNAARRLAGGDRGDEAGPAVDHLLSLFEGARTPEEQALALQALGNTGDPRALSAIDAALSSPHEIVRAAAAAALRFIADPSVDPRLALLIATDRAASVRRSAVFAAGYRELSPLLPALSEAARSDAEVAVRLDIVNTFGRAARQLPALEGPLRWSAENDPSPDVRQAASAHLRALH